MKKEHGHRVGARPLRDCELHVEDTFADEQK